MVLCVFVCRYAASVKDGSQYFVLLIITDGVISDMAQAKESIVNVRGFYCSWKHLTVYWARAPGTVWKARWSDQKVRFNKVVYCQDLIQLCITWMPLSEVILYLIHKQ